MHIHIHSQQNMFHQIMEHCTLHDIYLFKRISILVVKYKLKRFFHHMKILIPIYVCLSVLVPELTCLHVFVQALANSN